MEERLPRKLAAILHADVAGYSRLAGKDEDATHRRLKTSLDLIGEAVSSCHGRVVNYAGDAALAVFDAVVDAVCCAVMIQAELAELNADLPGDRRILFRIGVNLGDVIEDDDDIFGDGVNVAARIQGLAEPGGVCISESVFAALGNQLPLEFEDIGSQAVKNITDPVHAYLVHMKPGAELPRPVQRQVRERNPPSTRKSLLLGLAILVLVAAAVAVAWLKPWQGQQQLAVAPQANTLLADKPSIAVLPFENISGDPEQDYFADGMTEDLITDLSKISGLFVVARNSSFSYRGTSTDVRQISIDLGVKYILEGSVRRVGEQIRINAQLIDGETGGHLWAERFDGTMADVFLLQDNVNQKIVSELAVSLTVDDRKRLENVETTNPDAYDMLLRGFEQYQLFAGVANADARESFKRAVELDPGYARAYANVALTYASAVNFNWTDNREESIKLGLEFAEKALEIDDTIPQIYLTRSMLYMAQRRYHAAVEAAQRTIEVHPNYVDGYAALAFVQSYAGEHEAALAAIHRAKQLDPNFSYIYLAVEGRILFLLRRYDEALEVMLKSTSRNPAFERAQLILASIYAQLGEIDNAQWAVAEAMSVKPGISLADEKRNLNYKIDSDLDHYIEALRKAGVPEL